MEIKKTRYVKPFLDEAFIPASRPSHYPTPEITDLLFFIQRNHNTDTIIYQVNRTPNGLINMNDPINVFWLKYKENDIFRNELNYLQRKLAYGYNFNVISNELIEIDIVSYAKRMFLAKSPSGNFAISTKINNESSRLDHAYIYAEENGVFPDVKFIELFGFAQRDGKQTYEKIEL